MIYCNVLFWWLVATRNTAVFVLAGTLGVVTNVTLKIRPVPAKRVYGSVVFPDLSKGIAWMRDVAAHRCQPASLRLMDNAQFRFGKCPDDAQIC